jgi:hypothetical protein
LRRHFRVIATLSLSVEVWAAHWRIAWRRPTQRRAGLLSTPLFQLLST